MAKKENIWSGFGKHIGNAIFANLLAFFISAISFFFIAWLLKNVTSEQSTINLLAGSAALVLWYISCGLFVLIARYGEPFKKNLKYIGYYFPLTTLFVWAFDQRSLRLKAEEKIRRLEKIVGGWPDVQIIAGIIDPEKQKETLVNIIDEMDNKRDHDLAQIVSNIRRYAEYILASVGEKRDYYLFRQVIEKLSLYEPNRHPETYTGLLSLLSDVFKMPARRHFNRLVQKDMIGPLKSAIWRVDEPHLNRMGTIIEQIMADEEAEHDLAGRILDMLVILDWKEKKEICQIIFDESKKRAFEFPQGFGFDFLNTLRQLGHKVFWLDIQSLRDILEEAIKNGDSGLINLKRKAYDELCSTVFSPIEFEENKIHTRVRSGRVFWRLSGVAGQVKVECTLPDDSLCTCEAGSLSLRGLYSRMCTLKVGQKMKAKLIPIVEIGQAKPKHEFILSASVTKLHPVEATEQSEGRGILFEDADEEVVKRLYEYISEHHK